MDAKLLNKKGARLLCLLISVFWGFGFILTPLALKSGATPAFVCVIRFGVAALLYAFIFNKKINLDKKSLFYGMLCGTFLFLGFMLQTCGMLYTTPTKSAFITAFTTVLVPFVVWPIFKKRPSHLVFLSLIPYVLGIFLLCGGLQGFENFSLGIGDVLTLFGSVSFALHFATVSFSLTKISANNLNLVQFATAAVLFALYYLIFDVKTQVVIDFSQLLLPVLFITLLSTIFAYSVQTSAQRLLPAYEVSIILGLETLWAGILSVGFGFEEFTVNLPVGGFLVIIAILLSDFVPQLFASKARKNAACCDTEDGQQKGE